LRRSSGERGWGRGKYQEKIQREREKDKPNEGLIAHWEEEIRAFQEAIRRAKKRLGGEEERQR